MLAQTQSKCLHFTSNRVRSLSQIPRASRNGSTAAAETKRSHVANYSPLGSLVSRNRVPEAVKYLEESLESNKRVHALAVGDLLEVLCQQGKHDTAWQLLRRLSSSKARLPLQVLHRLLKVAGQHGTVNDVLAVYDHQQQYYGFASAAVQTTLIHALLKAHSKAMPGNLLAYESWVQLKTSGRQLDAQALLAGIHAAISVGRSQEAENILAALKETAGAVGRPVVSGYNIIMKAHAAAGNFEAARKLFATMKSRGLTPDVVTYNTLLTSFVRAGELVRARAVLEKMKRERVQPDQWSYTTYALGLGQQAQLQEMDAVWQEMVAAGVQPNTATYAAAIDAYATAGQPAAAHALLQQLLQQQQQQQQRQGADQFGSQQQVFPDKAFQPPQQQQQQQKQQKQQQRISVAYNGNGNAAAGTAATAATGTCQQQQQQILSEGSLRQLYNTVIKGHLYAGASAAAADSTVASSSSNSFDEYRAILGAGGDQSTSVGSAIRSAVGVVQQGQSASVTAAVAAAAAEQQQQQQGSGYPAAVAVLQEMSGHGVAPGVDTYTLFINHAIQVGDQGGLQLLLEQMSAAGVQPDQVLLTCLLKAAGLSGDHSAALEIFDALMMAAVPSSNSGSSSSSSGSSASNGVGVAASTTEDVDADYGSSGNGRGAPAGGVAQPQQQQQQQQQQGRQYAVVPPEASGSSTDRDGVVVATDGVVVATETSSSSSSGNKPLQDNTQQQTHQQQQTQQQQQQQLLPKGHEQRLMPLTASAGPDAAAWNALAAALVQADRLPDAAAAVDRGVQAAQAAGGKTPPVQGFAALIRGYRNAAMKGKAVAALRQFLSLGGRPGRVMCNDVITVCLRDNDLKTARQVVRAMELTGSLTDDDIAGYEAWFGRWEDRVRATESAARRNNNPNASAAGANSSNGRESRGGSAAGAGQATAVERLKWWLGLPNNYYYAGEGADSSSVGGSRQQQQERQRQQTAGTDRQQHQQQ